MRLPLLVWVVYCDLMATTCKWGCHDSLKNEMPGYWWARGSNCTRKPHAVGHAALVAQRCRFGNILASDQVEKWEPSDQDKARFKICISERRSRTDSTQHDGSLSALFPTCTIVSHDRTEILPGIIIKRKSPSLCLTQSGAPNCKHL